MSIEAELHPLRSRFLSALGLRPRTPACVPEGVRVYSVGDIHGCAAALDELHALIVADASEFVGEKIIIYLGDYADRGPDSRGVIDRLMTDVPAGLKARFIKGNHDVALLDFLESAETYRAWRSFGAPETLLSYGVRPPLHDSLDKFEEVRLAFSSAIPAAHLDFFRSLEPSIVVGDYAFVHAGVRPGTSIKDQSEHDLLWIREEFLNCTTAHAKIIVHGHTPAPRPVRLHNRIGLDTGAYATGILTCAVLEGSQCRFIQAGAGFAGTAV